ncbi:MAG: hypothetical protein IJV02_02545 [Candidatus Methanomethylophilaceae archaeon]|nr:hypothetical protein [Candidatus Methanomethylophilaceae archaeon]
MSSNTNWGAITGAMLLLSIAAGLICFYVDGSWLMAIGLPIVIFGTFELLSSFFRNSEEDRWGTSESGAAVFFGFTLLAIGGAILVYHFANDIIFPIVYAIVLAAVYLLLRASVKRNE